MGILSTLISFLPFNTVESKPIDKMDSTLTQKGSIYDFELNALSGESIDLSKYKGKHVLLVNVASKCGYTYQYDGLQKLHEEFGDKLVVLGFPANNFAKQEPGSSDEIATFCKKNYGVLFQMFEKIDVTGKNQHPLYNWLGTKELNGWNDKSPHWNFWKYLIDDKGTLLKVYNSKAKPMETIFGDLKELLK